MVGRHRILALLGVSLGLALGVGSGFGQDSGSRLPVPPEDAQARAREMVEQLFKRDFAAAKTPAEKAALFRKLADEAEKAKDDPAGRFILLAAARDLAIQAGDLDLAVEAVDELADVYSVNALAMKEDLLRAAGRATKDPGQFAMIADRAVGLIEEAVAQEDYERAGRIGKLGTAAAQKAKDPKLVKAIVARLKEVKKQESLFEESQQARAVLAKDANDAEANLTVGRYLCLVKGDWPGGLRFLALGSDKALKHLAARETQKDLSTDQQVSLADGWWAIGEEMEGRARDQALLHAGSWYRRALAGLPDTLAKRRVEQRLAEIAQIKAPALPRSSLPKLLTNSIGMKLVLIRAGEFLMGSTQAEIQQYANEAGVFKLDPQDKRHDHLKNWYNPGAVQHEGPQHRVRITRPFYLGIYEVTQAEYEAVTKKNPSSDLLT
jgi:formylglycine-generating enzyme required for sulfatase activity